MGIYTKCAPICGLWTFPAGANWASLHWYWQLKFFSWLESLWLKFYFLCFYRTLMKSSLSFVMLSSLVNCRWPISAPCTLSDPCFFISYFLLGFWSIWILKLCIFGVFLICLLPSALLSETICFSGDLSCKSPSGIRRCDLTEWSPTIVSVKASSVLSLFLLLLSVLFNKD